MKFLTTKGAPNIPLEVLEAQESKNLVFFCGAGVSYSAGLPGFAGLVNKVYERLNAVKSDSEKEAIKAGLYDRALGLLEARIIGDSEQDTNLARGAIIQELTLAENANLQNHKAILQLSKIENQKYRLVTTNVDHGFLHANETIPGIIDAAPKLPVPKPHRWKSIVHLHGIIDSNDPNGNNLMRLSIKLKLRNIRRWGQYPI
jgi:NAD-dependent SIR2 family protein deacetylase